MLLCWRVLPCLQMMLGRSCGVPCLELGPCCGTVAVQGTATHQVALLEQSLAPRQRNLGWNMGMLWDAPQHPHGLCRTRVFPR